jgi:hypothetical protein
MWSFGMQKLFAVRGCSLGAGALSSAPHHIGQVVLLGLRFGKHRSRYRPELLIGQERLAFVIERPTVSAYIVEPHYRRRRCG